MGMKNIAPIILMILMVGISCKEKKKYHDTAKAKSQEIVSDAVEEIIQFQKELDEEFRNPDTSPLPDRYRKNFEGLEFFEPDTTYRVKARLVRTPDAVPFMMPTTTSRESEEVVYGIAHFELNDKDYQLEIYQNKELMLQEEYVDYLFLPFSDQTNANETYGGGRYIDLSIPEGDTIIIDFNKAYNPYCVYNKKYSCPLVPKINTLATRIPAGVMDFKK